MCRTINPADEKGASLMVRRSLVILAIAVLTVSPLPAAAQTGSDPVVEWNAIMVSTVSGQNPFAQARFAAITQLAVFEAVNSITGEYESYLDPVDAPAGSSAEAAAAEAAHDVLVTYFPGAAATLDAALATSLAAIPDGASKDDGIAVGAAAAAELVALRTGDGSAPPAFYQPTSTDPGEWQTTPTCPAAGGILFHWQNLRPFGIASNAQFRSDAPPSLTSREYTKDYAEVMAVGAGDSTARPADRADVARLYAALSAVGAWNAVARALASEHPLSLTDHARALALLNLAMSDGLASSIETKYHYRFWRPETAIRAGDADGNDRTAGRSDFAPYIATPCFPSYPSAHASASYAGRWILERTWEGADFSVTLSHPAVPTVAIEYTTLKQLTDDIDDARIYGGIHFRFDQEAGGIQGHQIANYVLGQVLEDQDD
jgi:membrane-associated phospholipid phosphatase